MTIFEESSLFSFRKVLSILSADCLGFGASKELKQQSLPFRSVYSQGRAQYNVLPTLGQADSGYPPAKEAERSRSFQRSSICNASAPCTTSYSRLRSGKCDDESLDCLNLDQTAIVNGSIVRFCAPKNCQREQCQAREMSA